MSEKPHPGDQHSRSVSLTHQGKHDHSPAVDASATSGAPLGRSYSTHVPPSNSVAGSDGQRPVSRPRLVSSDPSLYGLHTGVSPHLTTFSHIPLPSTRVNSQHAGSSGGVTVSPYPSSGYRSLSLPTASQPSVPSPRGGSSLEEPHPIGTLIPTQASTTASPSPAHPVNRLHSASSAPSGDDIPASQSHSDVSIDPTVVYGSISLASTNTHPSRVQSTGTRIPMDAGEGEGEARHQGQLSHRLSSGQKSTMHQNQSFRLLYHPLPENSGAPLSSSSFPTTTPATGAVPGTIHGAVSNNVDLEYHQRQQYDTVELLTARRRQYYNPQHQRRVADRGNLYDLIPHEIKLFPPFSSVVVDSKRQQNRYQAESCTGYQGSDTPPDRSSATMVQRGVIDAFLRSIPLTPPAYIIACMPSRTRAASHPHTPSAITEALLAMYSVNDTYVPSTGRRLPPTLLAELLHRVIHVLDLSATDVDMSRASQNSMGVGRQSIPIQEVDLVHRLFSLPLSPRVSPLISTGYNHSAPSSIDPQQQQYSPFIHLDGESAYYIPTSHLLSLTIGSCNNDIPPVAGNPNLDIIRPFFVVFPAAAAYLARYLHQFPGSHLQFQTYGSPTASPWITRPSFFPIQWPSHLLTAELLFWLFSAGDVDEDVAQLVYKDTLNTSHQHDLLACSIVSSASPSHLHRTMRRGGPLPLSWWARLQHRQSRSLLSRGGLRDINPLAQDRHALELQKPFHTETKPQGSPYSFTQPDGGPDTEDSGVPFNDTSPEIHNQQHHHSAANLVHPPISTDNQNNSQCISGYNSDNQPGENGQPSTPPFSSPPASRPSLSHLPLTQLRHKLPAGDDRTKKLSRLLGSYLESLARCYWDPLCLETVLSMHISSTTSPPTHIKTHGSATTADALSSIPPKSPTATPVTLYNSYLFTRHLLPVHVRAYRLAIVASLGPSSSSRGGDIPRGTHSPDHALRHLQQSYIPVIHLLADLEQPTLRTKHKLRLVENYQAQFNTLHHARGTPRALPRTPGTHLHRHSKAHYEADGSPRAPHHPTLFRTRKGQISTAVILQTSAHRQHHHLPRSQHQNSVTTSSPSSSSHLRSGLSLFVLLPAYRTDQRRYLLQRAKGMMTAMHQRYLADCRAIGARLTEQESQSDPASLVLPQPDRETTTPRLDRTGPPMMTTATTPTSATIPSPSLLPFQLSTPFFNAIHPTDFAMYFDAPGVFYTNTSFDCLFDAYCTRFLREWETALRQVAIMTPSSPMSVAACLLDQFITARDTLTQQYDEYGAPLHHFSWNHHHISFMHGTPFSIAPWAVSTKTSPGYPFEPPLDTSEPSAAGEVLPTALSAFPVPSVKVRGMPSTFHESSPCRSMGVGQQPSRDSTDRGSQPLGDDSRHTSRQDILRLFQHHHHQRVLLSVDPPAQHAYNQRQVRLVLVIGVLIQMYTIFHVGDQLHGARTPMDIPRSQPLTTGIASRLLLSSTTPQLTPHPSSQRQPEPASPPAQHAPSLMRLGSRPREYIQTLSCLTSPLSRLQRHRRGGGFTFPLQTSHHTEMPSGNPPSQVEDRLSMIDLSITPPHPCTSSGPISLYQYINPHNMFVSLSTVSDHSRLLDAPHEGDHDISTNLPFIPSYRTTKERYTHLTLMVNPPVAFRSPTLPSLRRWVTATTVSEHHAADVMRFLQWNPWVQRPFSLLEHLPLHLRFPQCITALQQNLNAIYLYNQSRSTGHHHYMQQSWESHPSIPLSSATCVVHSASSQQPPVGAPVADSGGNSNSSLQAGLPSPQYPPLPQASQYVNHINNIPANHMIQPPLVQIPLQAVSSPLTVLNVCFALIYHIGKACGLEITTIAVASCYLLFAVEHHFDAVSIDDMAELSLRLSRTTAIALSRHHHPSTRGGNDAVNNHAAVISQPAQEDILPLPLSLALSAVDGVDTILIAMVCLVLASKWTEGNTSFVPRDPNDEDLPTSSIPLPHAITMALGIPHALLLRYEFPLTMLLLPRMNITFYDTFYFLVLFYLWEHGEFPSMEFFLSIFWSVMGSHQ